MQKPLKRLKKPIKMSQLKLIKRFFPRRRKRRSRSRKPKRLLKPKIFLKRKKFLTRQPRRREHLPCLPTIRDLCILPISCWTNWRILTLNLTRMHFTIPSRCLIVWTTSCSSSTPLIRTRSSPVWRSTRLISRRHRLISPSSRRNLLPRLRGPRTSIPCMNPTTPLFPLHSMVPTPLMIPNCCLHLLFLMPSNLRTAKTTLLLNKTLCKNYNNKTTLHRLLPPLITKH